MTPLEPGPAATGFATPAKVIDAWYSALAKGSIKALKPVSTPDLYANLDPVAFEGRTKVVKFEIVTQSIEGSDGTVDVRETQKGKKPAVVTYVVTKGPKGWLVTGFSPSFTAVGGSGPASQTETPSEP